jgi:2-polyprenyl-3-methyl-5-hydroxy-6-metoxy-1,4-benzoquinol methylase
MSAMDYPETADIETSSDDYAGRFAGPVGEWMLGVQEQITLELLADQPKATILDVGGGHGQLAVPLCHQGFDVTVLGSADSCRHRIQSVIDKGRCKFVVGNVIALPFPDKSFDVTLCFRLLPHCGQWEKLISELCRVSKQAVIVDYPTTQSVNAFAPMLFGAKKKIEKNTRTWRMFSQQEVGNEFRRNGTKRMILRKQFFLPMALHRMLKKPSLSKTAEGVCRMLGLTSWLGSPVILKASLSESLP